MERRLAAILVTDVVGYSKLVSENESEAVEAVQRFLTDMLCSKVTEAGGRTVKFTGDGLIAEFRSAVEAVECGLTIQDGPGLNSKFRGGIIQVRVGISLGDVLGEGGDVFGDGVIVASRLESVAQPGCICITDSVYGVIGSLGRENFEDIGVHHLKNRSESVRVFQTITKKHTPKTGAKPRFDHPTRDDRARIGVMPFRVYGRDEDQEFLSEGIPEDIVIRLSKIPSLLVLSRDSTFSYKAATVKPSQVCEELDVALLVAGSVRRSGSRLRITAHLVDGRSGEQLWADTYDRDASDVFAVQDEITDSIVNSLKIELSTREQLTIERRFTQSAGAYEYYLQGRAILHDMTESSIRRSRELFEAARSLDGDYVLAVLGIAECDLLRRLYYNADQEVVTAALRECRLTLDVAPDLAEAHATLALALWLAGDRSGSREEFEAARALDPMLYEAHWYAGMLECMDGNINTAKEHFENAYHSRGDDLQSALMVMSLSHAMGDRASLDAVAGRAYDCAVRQIKLNRTDIRAAYIAAMSMYWRGNTEGAQEWAIRASSIPSKDSRVQYNLACLFSLLNETDRALQHLEMSIRSGRSVNMKDWTETDPDLVNIRRFDQFSELMRNWGSSSLSSTPGSADESR